MGFLHRCPGNCRLKPGAASDPCFKMILMPSKKHSNQHMNESRKPGKKPPTKNVDIGRTASLLTNNSPQSDKHQHDSHPHTTFRVFRAFLGPLHLPLPISANPKSVDPKNAPHSDTGKTPNPLTNS